jgi:uncharacterized damage-inducible protein DinB
MESQTRRESRLLADQLERSYRGGAWHGPALAEAIAGLDPQSAARRPVDSAHSIVEIVAHTAYWADAARRRVGGGTADPGETRDDWPTSPGDAAAAWSSAVATLDQAHRELVAGLAALDDARLDDAVAGSDPTLRGLLLGLLQHNAYHAGQIVLLRKALGAESRP